MPLYQYWCRACKRTSADWASMSEMKKKIRCVDCGRHIRRLLSCNIPAPKALGTIHSNAMGVMPEQVPEARAYAISHGLTGFEFDKDGDLDFADKKARRDFAEVHGFHDIDAGYSDPTPTTENRKEEIEHEDVDNGTAHISGNDTADVGGGCSDPIFLND